MTDNARIYTSQQDASEAVDRLVSDGFNGNDILLLSPTGDHEAQVAAAIASEHLPDSYKSSVSRSLAAGHHVVAINAPFGSSMRAGMIMDSCNPIDTDTLPSRPRNNPSPFSDFLGIPTLSHARPGASLANNWSLSEKLGIPMISHKAMPLSSLFGLKGITASKSKNSSMGLPLLTRSGKPSLPIGQLTRSKSKNSSFGLPLLSKNATPLSSMFGMRILSKRD